MERRRDEYLKKDGYCKNIEFYSSKYQQNILLVNETKTKKRDKERERHFTLMHAVLLYSSTENVQINLLKFSYQPEKIEDRLLVGNNHI